MCRQWAAAAALLVACVQPAAAKCPAIVTETTISTESCDPIGYLSAADKPRKFGWRINDDDWGPYYTCTDMASQYLVMCEPPESVLKDLEWPVPNRAKKSDSLLPFTLGIGEPS